MDAIARFVPIDQLPDSVYNSYLSQASQYDALLYAHDVSRGRAYHLSCRNTVTGRNYTLLATARGKVLDRMEV